MLHRRGLILGLLTLPAIIRTPGLLMAVKPPAEVVSCHAICWRTASSDAVGSITITCTPSYFQRWVREILPDMADLVLGDRPFVWRAPSV